MAETEEGKTKQQALAEDDRLSVSFRRLLWRGTRPLATVVPVGWREPCVPARGADWPWHRSWQTAGVEAGLRVQEGGSGEPVLLLLHGLGATGDVWDGWRPLLARRWPGRWLAPDLPGHGGSQPLPEYTFDAMAAAVAGIARRRPHRGAGTFAGRRRRPGPGRRRFPVPVHAVIGLGIKVAWTRRGTRPRPGHGAPAGGLVRLA